MTISSREALRQIKLVALTYQDGPAALSHITRICLDAGIAEKLNDLSANVDLSQYLVRYPDNDLDNPTIEITADITTMTEQHWGPSSKRSSLYYVWASSPDAALKIAAERLTRYLMEPR
jgi:hypothetical protein